MSQVVFEAQRLKRSRQSVGEISCGVSASRVDYVVDATTIWLHPYRYRSQVRRKICSAAEGQRHQHARRNMHYAMCNVQCASRAAIQECISKLLTNTVQCICSAIISQFRSSCRHSRKVNEGCLPDVKTNAEGSQKAGTSTMEYSITDIQQRRVLHHACRHLEWQSFHSASSSSSHLPEMPINGPIQETDGRQTPVPRSIQYESLPNPSCATAQIADKVVLPKRQIAFDVRTTGDRLTQQERSI